MKKDLIKGSLSEKEQFKYLLANTIIISLAMIPVIENNIMNIYFAIIAGIITVFGAIYIYKVNGSANGKYLLQRFLSLGWVMAMRWSVLIMLPVMIIFFTILEIFSPNLIEVTSIYDILVFSILYLIYFYILGKHVKDVVLN